MTGKSEPQNKDGEEQAAVICDICGSVKIQEDNKLVCPHCDGEIDYFGDENDEDTE